MINLRLTSKSSFVFISTLLLSLNTWTTYSQETQDDEIDLLLDELFFNDELLTDELINAINGYHLIYTTISYNSNTFFSGRDIGINQYNIVPQFSYFHPLGFVTSISGVYYERFDPQWDFINISLSYSNTIGKKRLWHYSGGYTRYFLNDGFNAFTNSLDFTFGIRSSKKTLGTRLSGSYLFGEDQAFQLVSTSFGTISLKKNKNFSLKLRPQLSFIVAEQTIAFVQPVITDGMITRELVFDDVFELLNTQIKIPLSYNSKSWDIEVGYTLNIPRAVGREQNVNANGFFNVNLGYVIPLN